MKHLFVREVLGALSRPQSVAYWLAERHRLSDNKNHVSRVRKLGERLGGVMDPAAALGFGMKVPDSELSAAARAYALAKKRVYEAYGHNGQGREPSIISRDDALVLYSAIRASGSATVVETGVSDGLSTLIILMALAKNGGGSLESIDLPLVGIPRLYGRPPGWLVPSELSSSWTLHVGPSRKLLPRVLSRLGRIDAFFHDSEHSMRVMSEEFRIASTHLRKGGLVISDDVLANDAFLEFASTFRPDSSTHLVTRDGLGLLRIEK